MVDRSYLVARLDSLAQLPIAPDAAVRLIRDDELDALGALAADALASTVDAPGHDERACAVALHSAATGGAGQPIREAWLVIDDLDGSPAAFLTTTEWWGGPFAGFIMTRRDQQRRGLASTLLAAAATNLLNLGHAELGLRVSNANPAAGVYRQLGFDDREIPDS